VNGGLWDDEDRTRIQVEYRSVVDDTRRKRHFPRVYLVAIAVLLLLVAGVVALIVTAPSTGPLTLPLPSGLDGPGAHGSGTQGPALDPTAPSGGPTTGPSGTPSAAPSGSAEPTATPTPPAPAPLSARYSTVDRGVLGLSGYKGQVRIANPGTVTVTGWQVVLTLPDGATVANTSGAEAQQSQGTVTFSPTDATRNVNGGTIVVFSFDVRGLMAGEPTGCAIDGRPCEAAG
jgi:hypothetical protein